MGLEPPSGAPYRTSGRAQEPARAARRHVRAGTSVVRLLGVPRFVGLVLVGTLAWSFGDLNRMIVRLDGVPTPDVVRAGNLAALALLASIPVVSLLVWRASRGLPAPRAVKRSSIRRSAALQTAAVLAGLLLAIGTRPASKPVVAEAEGADGRVAYLGRWDWTASSARNIGVVCGRANDSPSSTPYATNP